jgi:hypothetical protein
MPKIGDAGALRHPRRLWTAKRQTHISPDVALESHMKNILIATTAALVVSAPLAFAATAPISNAALTTLHCSHVEQIFSKNRDAYKSEAAFQVAEQKALSLCRQSKDGERQ